MAHILKTPLAHLNFIMPTKGDYLTWAGMSAKASISHHEHMAVILDHQDFITFVEVSFMDTNTDECTMAIWEGEAMMHLFRNSRYNFTHLHRANSIKHFEGLAESMNATQVGF